MHLDLLKEVSAMVVAGAASRSVAGEGPARETRRAAMRFDLLTVVSAMVLARLVTRSLRRRGEKKGGDKRAARAARRQRVGEDQCGGFGLRSACLFRSVFRLPVVGTLKRYSKVLEYEYRVKTAALGTLKRYSILSLTLYLE
jgi:hypothetical protein